MADFNGTLNTNVWHDGLFNAYLLVRTLSDTLALDDSLAAMFRADADLYHDQFVYTDVDVLDVRNYDINDTDVTKMEQRGKIKQQTIAVTEAKQIGFTAGPWLAKAAWQDATSFSNFQSELDSMVSKTRKLYEQQMMEIYFGSMLEATSASQNVEIEMPTNQDPEKQGRLQAQTFCYKLANIFDAVRHPSRSYNDNGFYHAYTPDQLGVIFNSDFKNKVLTIDLPTVYNNGDLRKVFDGKALVPEIWGKKTAASVTTTGTANTTIRATDELDVTDTSKVKHHVKPGELLPANVALENGCVASVDLAGNKVLVPTATADSKILCKIYAKEGIKYLSAMETSTEFFNSKNLSKNRYLTFAYAKPVYLKGYPLITIRSK